MNLIVKKTTGLFGAATAPSSKSQTIRGLLFALLAQGQSTLSNVLDSDDTQDAIRVCEALGATVTRRGAEILVESPGLPLPARCATMNSGNSGITTHFVTPLIGLRRNAAEPMILDCGEQMRARSSSALANALNNLGMDVRPLSNTRTYPLSISGRLRGGVTAVDGFSSQYLSALLIALPCAEQDSEVTVTDLHERPYADITLHWLQEQHIRFQHRVSANQDIFTIPGGQRYLPFQKILTGDFSSASYLIAAAALFGDSVELRGLDMHDQQGDKKLVEILCAMGADITVEPARLIIRGGKPLTGMRIDANDIPDLLPTLAVIGTQAAGATTLYNVKQARNKETDRIHSMTEGLTRLGARVEEHADGMTVYPSTLTGAAVRGFSDHRTVMALAIAGLGANGVTAIDEAESIHKTFPTFIETMRSLGAAMEIRHGA